MKLSDYAKKKNITYRTAWNHFKAGKIPNAHQLESGTVVIDEHADTKDELISLQREKIKHLEETIDKLIDFDRIHIANEAGVEILQSLTKLHIKELYKFHQTDKKIKIKFRMVDGIIDEVQYLNFKTEPLAETIPGWLYCGNGGHGGRVLDNGETVDKTFHMRYVRETPERTMMHFDKYKH